MYVYIYIYVYNYGYVYIYGYGMFMFITLILCSALLWMYGLRRRCLKNDVRTENLKVFFACLDYFTEVTVA